MMDKHALWGWAVKNSINMICWAALAIYFGKWWIALFAILLSSSATIRRHYRICDGCGRHSPYADSYNGAIDRAAEAGWLTKKNGDKWEDYCPECRKKMEG